MVRRFMDARAALRAFLGARTDGWPFSAEAARYAALFAPPAAALAAAGSIAAWLGFAPAAALAGLSAGWCGGAALASSQPFAARRWPPAAAAAAAGGLAVSGFAAGWLAGGGAAATALALAAAGAAAAPAWRVASRRADGGEEYALLPDAEIADRIEYGKRSGERWVLVTGAAGAGKSALVGQLMEAALGGEAAGLDAPPRRSEQRGGARVAELRVRRGGETFRLWFWESRAAPGTDGAPPADALDGVILVADPRAAAGVAGTLPAAMATASLDIAPRVLALAEALSGASPRGVWAVISKADVLRYAVSPALIGFPVRTGPAWYEQMSALPLDFEAQNRRELARRIGLDCLVREYEPHFAWSAGSPYLAYTPPSGAIRPAFPGDALWSGVLDAVT